MDDQNKLNSEGRRGWVGEERGCGKTGEVEESLVTEGGWRSGGGNKGGRRLSPDANDSKTASPNKETRVHDVQKGPSCFELRSLHLFFHHVDQRDID